MANPWEMFDEKPEELIKQSAKKYGVDPKFVRAVAKTESNFNPKAIGPPTRTGERAQGVMQLMPATSKRLGVKDPLDATQNIDAGAQELARLDAKYKGDKTKAAAAYNAGEGAVDKSGGVPDIPETKDYVQKVNGEYGKGSDPWEQFSDEPWNKFGGGNDTESLRAQHEANRSAERLQGLVGPLNTAAQFVRGATPAIAAAAGLTPAIAADPLIFGGGELIAQQLEKLGGSRENINPYTVAQQGALGAIPMPDVAKYISSKTAHPGFWYPFLKAPEGAAQGMGFTAASNITDKLTGEGETPTPSLGEFANAGLAGGTIAAIGSLARIRHIARQATEANYKMAGDRIYAGVDMPKTGQRAEQTAKSFDNWMPIIHKYADVNKLQINNLNDLRAASDGMKSHFYEQAYLPLVQPILQQQVSTQPIYDAVKDHLTSNHKLMVEQPEMADKILKKLEVYQNATLPVEDLLKLRNSYNKATSNMTEKLRMTPGFKANVKGEADLAANAAIRNVLDDAVQKFHGNNIDVKEILRTYRDVEDVAGNITAAAQTNDATKRLERGQRLPLLNTVARPIARSSTRGGLHSTGGAILTSVAERYNQPDNLVKSGFKLLRRVTPTYDLPISGVVPGQQGQMGQGAGPIPTPPQGLQQQGPQGLQNP